MAPSLPACRHPLLEYLGSSTFTSHQWESTMSQLTLKSPILSIKLLQSCAT